VTRQAVAAPVRRNRQSEQPFEQARARDQQQTGRTAGNRRVIQIRT